MYYLLLLDDGHGSNTPGKRTPIFPPGHPRAGEFMPENEFNHAVKKKIVSKLAHKDAEDMFEVFVVAPGDLDWSINDRVNRSNRRFAELRTQYGSDNVKAAFVSIHANAFRGYWSTEWGGVETLHFPGSREGIKLAQFIQDELKKEEGLRDRGLKPRGDLGVLRGTRMPACLVEAAFMDNPNEADLLICDDYRARTADRIITGVMNYFDIKDFEFRNVDKADHPMVESVIENQVEKSADNSKVIAGLKSEISSIREQLNGLVSSLDNVIFEIEKADKQKS